MKRAIAYLLLTSALTACLPLAPTGGLGFILVDGEIHMLVNRCDGEEIVEVNVRTTSDLEAFEPEDLWLIEGREDSVIDEWVIGETPEGFAESMPLEADLLSMDAFGVYVTFSGGFVASDSVYPEDLSEDAVILARREYSRDEFFALDCDY